MNFDYARKKQVEREIEGIARKELLTTGVVDAVVESALRELMGTAINISPPEERPQFMEMIVMNSSARGGGRSTKPGNIRLDLGLVLDNVLAGALTLESIDTWWTLPVGLLMVLRSFSKNLSVSLTESEAVTILSMWQAGIHNNAVASFSDIKICADLHAAKYQRRLLSPAEIKYSIENLVAIGSVRPIAAVADKWQVCEEIRFNYR